MAPKLNRLGKEQSPYLLQHATNPVDWYPWGPEALERARRENRPILLSIGYSACHWCHVMERESFENEATARLMNEGFVNIKVDREERPDIDTIYMNAVQMMTGSGGWPLTAFLLPDAKPFYVGTYFPPEDRYGRPGFPRVLAGVLHAYHQKPAELQRTIDELLEGFGRLSQFEASDEAFSPTTLSSAAKTLFNARDHEHGGIGKAPKFPNTPAFQLLLREDRAQARPDMRAAFLQTLDGMALGGMYDQLGGGFHRYSVDERWLVPHFEKMLYDNAQLAPLYLDGFVATGNPLYERVARETLDYLLRDMRHPQGGFYSAQDADTNGEEGQTYLWRLPEIKERLSVQEADFLTYYFQVEAEGNFAEPGHTERKSILHVNGSIEDLARHFDCTAEVAASVIEGASATLFAARQERDQPARDEKILASWNSLAIRAFVRGACVLDREDYRHAAERTAAFIETNLYDQAGGLLRTCTDGIARYPAYLDDHAFLAAALLDLFVDTGAKSYLDQAVELAETLLRDFHDETVGGFFFTTQQHSDLIDRPKVAFDGSIPSGNAVAIETFLRLGHLLDEPRTERLGPKVSPSSGICSNANPWASPISSA